MAAIKAGGTAPRVSAREFRSRREAAVAAAAERGLAGLVVWSRGGSRADHYGDVAYLTGHHSTFPTVGDAPAWAARGHSALVLPLEGPGILLTDYLDDPDNRVEVDEVRLALQLPGAVGETLEELGLAEKPLGLVGRETLALAWYKQMEYAAKRSLDATAADDILGRLRAVKSETELELVRNAAAVGVEWMNTTMGAIAEGRTEGDAVGEGLRYLASRGGTLYDVAIASGPNSNHYFGSSGMPHWNATRPLERGDLVHVDQWGPVDGYFTDFARSTVVGLGPTDAQREVLEASVSLIGHVIEGVRPGATFGDLYERGSSWLADNGFASDTSGTDDEGQVFASQFPAFGHCIGLTVEEPWIVAEEDTPLLDNMVLAIECVVGRPGVGASNFEQNLIVSGEDPEILTADCRERWWD